MKDTFNLPNYKQAVYNFSIDAGCYLQTDRPAEIVPVTWLPKELKRELTETARVRAKTKEALTRMDIDKGHKKLLTGLYSTIWPNWYMGTHLRRNNGVKIHSALLIHFSTDNSVMSIFFFTGHPIAPDNYQQFAAMAIPAMIKSNFL